ncbi:MAG: ROK family transcriptional regulator [Pseudomonadota bacterium]
MDDGSVREISAGLSQSGVRDHNERLLLSLIQRHGGLPASDLSKRAGLSPPTVSTILRRLEGEGLVERGQPVRGKVGKPSTPMMLAADGAFAFGLKIGRRSAELVLVDFVGDMRDARTITYDLPDPDTILSFAEQGIAEIQAALSSQQASRVCGLGVGAAFELWHWPETGGVGRAELEAWRSINIREVLLSRTGLPVSLLNDATAACQAEHTYGRGREFQDYAYFFIGAYIGGGIVLDNAVYEGRQGNAGALGSLPSLGPNGESMQLLEMASIRQLEARLTEVDLDSRVLWNDPDSWTDLRRYVAPWLRQTAQELSKAALAVCAVIDFEAIIIDGAFPDHIRSDLVEQVRRYVSTQDTRGLIAPRIEAGTIGQKARAIGAGTRPLGTQFLL